jgi:hypothetical protein
VEHCLDLLLETMTEELTQSGGKITFSNFGILEMVEQQSHGGKLRVGNSIDWDKQQATCPQGKVNYRWRPQQTKYGTPFIRIEFSKADCSPCPERPLCTRSKSQWRALAVAARPQYEAMQAARQ